MVQKISGIQSNSTNVRVPQNPIIKFLRQTLKNIIWPPYSRHNFLKKRQGRGTLLDVGCGNDSSYIIKSNYPDIVYTGIDIGIYNQRKPDLADTYIITTPENFAEKIEEMSNSFDIVVSSHNLEHCNDRKRTLMAMIKALRKGGTLYLSFPSEESVNFPKHREGTLNYYDDPTHRDMPPNFNEIITTLKENDMHILFASKSYKPFFMHLLGFLLERKSKRENKVKYWTWAYWGFEAIIWAEKNSSK